VCWLPYDIMLCEGLTLGRRNGGPERVMVSIAAPIARAVQNNPARLDNEEFVDVRGFAKKTRILEMGVNPSFCLFHFLLYMIKDLQSSNVIVKNVLFSV
jgi:hypothetical protein